MTNQVNREKPAIIRVSRLNNYIKQIIEGAPGLKNIYVEGEISNFKRHAASGHLYFSLKDDQSTVSCVMFRSSAERLRFVPKSGDAVLIAGSVSVYAKTGVYQVYVDRMMPQGTGLLQIRYEELKQRLLEEGVFKSEAARRPLPFYPKKIGIVTSPTGAVIRDMVRVIERRWPIADILLCPANVQGQEGALSITNALLRLYERDDIDVIIVGRGGGSIEDLWNFNEELVVRTIASSPVPIVSAVGHETDFTLADLAADLRAGTPSIAAEMVVSDQDEVYAQLSERSRYLSSQMMQRLQRERIRLDAYLAGGLLADGARILSPYAQQLDGLYSELTVIMERDLAQRRQAFAKKTAVLDALSPVKVLARGFAYCEKQGRALHSVTNTIPGDHVTVRLSDGFFEASVDEVYKGELK